MTAILQTKNLTKVFKNHVGVDNLSINVERGQIYGFLGENGAGKTTTLKMILGLIPPTNGEIIMFGENVKKRNYGHFSKIGSIIEFPSFYENLTAYENLKLHEQYLNLKDEKLIDECIEKLGLSHAKNRKVGEFSLGMKQRLGIARAILHKPELLILDEPTNGLDPSGIKEIREFIQDLAVKDQISVIISSHILSEIQLLATQIGIIHKGKLVKETSMEALEKERVSYIKIKVNDDKKAMELLKHNLNVKDMKLENDYIIIDLKNDNVESSDISKLLVSNDIRLFEITPNKETLEDYFLRLIQEADDYNNSFEKKTSVEINEKSTSNCLI